MTLKIAVVTDNGERISPHFGRARYYKVFTVEDGHIVAEELRPRGMGGNGQGHGHGRAGHAHHEHEHEHEHGHGHHDHRGMLQPIADCQVLIAGGMGGPAFAAAQAAGLEVVLTGGPIRAAVEAYLRGELTTDPRRLHRH